MHVPPPAASVTLPVPVCPLVGKLQVVPEVGVANEKLAAFVPVMLCAVICSALVVPGFVMLTFVTGVVVPTLVGPRMIGDGLTIANGPGFAVIVKGNEVAGVGPPPGSGFVMVTVTDPGVVKREAATGTLKPLPPPVTVPKSWLPLNVTVVPGTKLVPEKVSVTGVYVVVLLGVMVFAVRVGFITVNGRDCVLAPCGSLAVTW